MNKAIFLALFSISVFTASSQRIYFIYLQTESQQPFFVKLDEKIHSSTASGYLILSRLKDSVYNFTIGFTGNTGGEQKFSCSINKKDHGYLVKNFGEKGWGLVDLQTSSVQMAVNDAKKDVSVVNTPVNAFTELLSKAADDSTLKQKNVLPEEKKAEPVVTAAVVKKDEPKETAINKPEEKNLKTDGAKTAAVVVPASAVIKQKEDSKETGINKAGQKSSSSVDTFKLQPQPSPQVNNNVSKKADDTVVKTEEQKVAVAAASESAAKPEETFVRSKVTKKSESSTTEGFGLTYVDTYADGTQDTIRIVIPNDTKIQLSDAGTKDTVAKTTSTETLATVQAQNPNNTSVKSKNACKEVATDADFYKLRKKMANGKSDGDMLDEAKKSFKAKCFTTMQVKNLSTMFLGDGGKYNFFDAAYLHITDVENFGGLQSELKDEYFINRFKAMVH
ncbi:MAG: DUF4476 domain-containing protein [Bacteroidota bacterium]